MNRLLEIAARRRQVIAREKAATPEDLLIRKAAAQPSPRGFAAALRQRPGAIIAEIKRASPSAGAIKKGAEAAEVAAVYEAAGARALSVLTEPDHFDGRVEDLVEARAATRLPALRKDFVVDPWQLLDSRAAGADAVLLIVALLGDDLGFYLARAMELGLDALVEVHDAVELDVAAGAGATLIGVNNRDLRDLSIDLAVTEKLAPKAPAGATLVAESGIATPADARRMFEAGAQALLVGSSLMAAADPAAGLAALRAAAPEAEDGLDQDLRHHAA